MPGGTPWYSAISIGAFTGSWDSAPYTGRFTQGIKASRIMLPDSSVITLFPTLFNWAHYSGEKGAIKLHALFPTNGFLPIDIHVSDGKMSDNIGAYPLMPPGRSIIVADRGYDDSQLWRDWDSRRISFVVRLHRDIKLERLEAFGQLGTGSRIFWQMKLSGSKAMIAVLLLQHLKNKSNQDCQIFNLVTFIRIYLMSYIDMWEWLEQRFEEPHSSPQWTYGEHRGASEKSLPRTLNTHRRFRSSEIIFGTHVVIFIFLKNSACIPF